MTGGENVLKRKRSRRGAGRSPLPETEFIGQTFARHIEKTLRPIVKTIISAVVLECKVEKDTEVVESISVPTMLGLVEFDNAKLQGLLNIDTDFAYHLIDLMLGGDPTVAPVPITRSFTAIDMSLCAIVQEGLLSAFSDALADCFDRPMVKRLQLAGQRQDVTQIRFAADHVDFLVYNIALDIGPAARSGGLQIVLPLAMLDTISAMLRDDTAKKPREDRWDLWKVSMRHAVVRAPVVLDAVLHQRRMAIAELTALRVGHVIDLPASAVTEVQLVVAQQDGKRATVAVGRLGTYQGEKVIKLNDGVDPRLRDLIRDLLSQSITTPRTAPEEAVALTCMPRTSSGKNRPSTGGGVSPVESRTCVQVSAPRWASSACFRSVTTNGLATKWSIESPA